MKKRNGTAAVAALTAVLLVFAMLLLYNQLLTQQNLTRIFTLIVMLI